MEWKPNKWIAIPLALFFQTLALLYVAQGKWAVFYFLVGIVSASTDFWLEIQQGSWHYFSLILAAICAIHVYIIIRNYEAIPIRPWFSRWYGLVSFFTTFVLVAVLFRSFLYEPFQIPSGAMSPTLNHQNFVIVDKWGYGNYGTYGFTLAKGAISKELKRGDIIVFENPGNRSINFVKRIVGLPGDSIKYDYGRLIINGEEVNQELLKSEGGFKLFTESLDGSNYDVKNMPARSSSYGIPHVPTGQFFVLGDNRDNSFDSRVFGGVPMENIVGKVIYIIKPD